MEMNQWILFKFVTGFLEIVLMVTYKNVVELYLWNKLTLSIVPESSLENITWICYRLVV